LKIDNFDTVENSARGYAASSSPKTRSAHTLTLKSWLLDFTPVFPWNSSSDLGQFELPTRLTESRRHDGRRNYSL
jgi:hypothetical protein